MEIRWRDLPPYLHYPTSRAFASTGYREEDGAAAIFSVYLELLDDAHPAAGSTQRAKVYALADSMAQRLPERSRTFVLSTGSKVVAECVAIDRGSDAGP